MGNLLKKAAEIRKPILPRTETTTEYLPIWYHRKCYNMFTMKSNKTKDRGKGYNKLHANISY